MKGNFFLCSWSRIMSDTKTKTLSERLLTARFSGCSQHGGIQSGGLGSGRIWSPVQVFGKAFRSCLQDIPCPCCRCLIRDEGLCLHKPLSAGLAAILTVGVCGMMLIELEKTSGVSSYVLRRGLNKTEGSNPTPGRCTLANLTVRLSVLSCVENII